MNRVVSAALLLALSLTCCTAHVWHARPTNIPPERRCKPLGEFPQMIQIPGFISAWELIERCDAYPPEKVSIAMSLFYAEWIKRFGPSEKVERVLNSVMVEFNSQKRGGAGYSEVGTKITDASFSGLTMTPGFIWVKVKEDPQLICETSFVHELVHIGIWALKGTDGDPDHLGQVYYGWTTRHSMLIQDVNQHLCRLGI